VKGLQALARDLQRAQDRLEKLRQANRIAPGGLDPARRLAMLIDQALELSKLIESQYEVDGDHVILEGRDT